MKKSLSLFLAIMLLIVSIPAMAEVDLTGMTYSELVALKDQINLAIWNSSEWQEVTVPQGVWKVGVDIPAGHWTVRCSNSSSYASISWGDKLTASGESISWSGRYSTMNDVYGRKSVLYSEGDLTEYSFEVTAGQYIVISFCSVIFTPYAGKPSLGFK